MTVKLDETQIKYRLHKSLLLINEYKWLLNSYVLDFYVENHWNSLPKSWQNALESTKPEQLIDLFKQCDILSTVWPLSLLSIRALLPKLNIPRQNYTTETEPFPPFFPFYTHPKLSKLFVRHVKPKKLHEIQKMSEICAKTARDCNVKYIVDFGSGLGHLVRILCYGYGLNVCGLEQQRKLTEQAGVIDKNIEKVARIYFKVDQIVKCNSPTHLNITLSEHTSVDEFLNKIMESFKISNENEFKFGIVGLHPCGNLATILMKLFLKCKQATFLNIVGCCYMKLSCDKKNEFLGYPLSSILLENSLSNLSYEAREIACHAEEMYLKRLECINYSYLKVHSYRAAIEQIIVKHWPNLKHSGLKSLKHFDQLTFENYCEKAVAHLNINIPLDDIHCERIKQNLSNWDQVVKFYTLRLLLAPLVESVLLYDRLLHVMENGHFAEIMPVFDPQLSPRNHILTAKKC